MIALFLILTAVSVATWAGWALWRSPWLLTQSIDERQPEGFIRKQVRYQTFFFVAAVAVALFANALRIEGSVQVFGAGTLTAPIQPGAFALTDPHGLSWLQLGSLLALCFTLATLALVFDSLRRIRWPKFLKRFGLWVIALSAVNALSEELIYRGAIVAVAQGVLGPAPIALLSAALFALVHIRGQASGIAVVAGSAVVGWFLAHAVLQTHGLFWAWFAHFMQDIVIFSAFIATTRHPPLDTERQQRVRQYNGE